MDEVIDLMRSNVDKVLDRDKVDDYVDRTTFISFACVS